MRCISKKANDLANHDLFFWPLQKWERRSTGHGQQLKHMTHNLCIDSTSVNSGQNLRVDVCDSSVSAQKWRFTLNSAQE